MWFWGLDIFLWRFGILAFEHFGVWRFCVSAFQRLSVLAFWRFGVLAYWRLGVWVFGHLGGWAFGRLVAWALGHLGALALVLWRFAVLAFCTLTYMDSSCHGSLLKTTPTPLRYPWVSGGRNVTPESKSSGLVLDY